MQTTNKHTVVYFDFDGTISNKDFMTSFLLAACPKKILIVNFLLFTFYIFLYLLRIVTIDHLKSLCIKKMLGGMKLSELQNTLHSWMQQRGEYYFFNQETVSRLKWHLAKEHDIVIVSANLDIFLQIFFDTFTLLTPAVIIATELELICDNITPKETNAEQYNKGYLLANCKLIPSDHLHQAQNNSIMQNQHEQIIDEDITQTQPADYIITGKVSSKYCLSDEKVSRIKHYLTTNNLHYSESYAYGNSSNDFAMLNFATYGFFVNKDQTINQWKHSEAE